MLDFLYANVAPDAGEASYILLRDIRMPQIDVIEVLRQVKSHAVLRSLPVVMLTTTEEPREIDRGCNDYICKPASFEKFAETLTSLGHFLPLLQLPHFKSAAQLASEASLESTLPAHAA